MNGERDISKRDRWARFRFSVIGPLLCAPPRQGDLRAELAHLAAKRYKHPITGTEVRFGLSTLERWYYSARDVADPIETLRNRLRKDAEHIRAYLCRCASSSASSTALTLAGATVCTTTICASSLRKGIRSWDGFPHTRWCAAG